MLRFCNALKIFLSKKVLESSIVANDEILQGSMKSVDQLRRIYFKNERPVLECLFVCHIYFVVISKAFNLFLMLAILTLVKNECCQ